MTLFGLGWSTLGPALAAGAAALVALYLLKERRRQAEVPYLGLWAEVLGAEQPSALGLKLRRLLSLALQLVILALLLLSLGDPRLARSSRGRTLALVVDLSASMQAMDGRGGESRLAEARQAARRLIEQLGSEDEALVIALDAQPAPLLGLTGDTRALTAAVDRLAATDAPADLERALRLASDALRGQPHPTLVLIGDGAFDPEVLGRARRSLVGASERVAERGLLDLSGLALHFIPVGGARPRDNVAVSAFAVRRYRSNRSSYEALVELQSFSATPRRGRLTLLADGASIESEELTLGPGERRVRTYPQLAGEGSVLEARLSLDGADLLSVDDRAVALLPPRRPLRLLLITDGNLFLEGALLLDDNLTVTKLAPAAYTPAALAGHDAVLFDGVAPEPPPPLPTFYLAPPRQGSPFEIVREVRAPIVTEVASAHPLGRWLALKDLNVSTSAVFKLAPGDVAIASSLRDPLLVARPRRGAEPARVALGFDVRRSDLPLRVAFPVLLVNTLEWFAGAETDLIGSYPTGRRWVIELPPEAVALRIEEPGGQRRELPAPRQGSRTVETTGLYSGLYRLEALLPDGTSRPLGPLAARLGSLDESRLDAAQVVTIEGQPLTPPAAGDGGQRRALWPLLCLLALLLLAVEWGTYHRRVTV